MLSCMLEKIVEVRKQRPSWEVAHTASVYPSSCTPVPIFLPSSTHINPKPPGESPCHPRALALPQQSQPPVRGRVAQRDFSAKVFLSAAF